VLSTVYLHDALPIWGQEFDISYEHKTRCPACAEEGGDRSGDNLHIYGIDGEGRFGGCRCFACGYTILSDDYREEIEKDTLPQERSEEHTSELQSRFE